MNGETLSSEDSTTVESHNNPKKGIWKNKLEYILSLAGYSTGSSDFWRFPYLIWRHGGGTFILVYVISAVIIAVPMYYLEVAAAQFSGRGMFDVWNISPIMKGLGIGMFIINVEYMSITPIFRAWIMQYIGYSCLSPLPWKRCNNPWNTPACVDSYSNREDQMNSTVNATLATVLTYNTSSKVSYTQVLAEEEFFLYKILQVSGSVYDTGTLRMDMCICLLVFTCACTASIIKSVDSIGKVMYVMTFLPLVLLVIVWIRTLLAPGAVAGMKYYLTPDLTKLGDIEIWTQAGFTAVYSLSTANGGNMEIGSRAKFRTNVFGTSLISSVIDMFGSIFTSMVVYSLIGVMAHESGMELGGALFSGNSAAFVAFSRAFSFFPLPNLWLVLFFVAFLVGTSDIMIFHYEILITFLKKYVPCLQNRPKRAFAAMFVVSFLLSLPFCTQVGPYFYQLFGWYTATWGVFVMAIIECVVFMWIYGGYMFDENVKLMNGTKMPHFIRLTAAFVCPVLFAVFLVLGITRYKPPVFGTYHYPSSIEGFGILIGILPLIPLVYWIILSLYRRRNDGCTKEGLSNLFQPNTLWGPADMGVIDKYREVAAEQKSWSQTAYYNLTGRQKPITHQETYEEPYAMTKMI